MICSICYLFIFSEEVQLSQFFLRHTLTHTIHPTQLAGTILFASFRLYCTYLIHTKPTSLINYRATKYYVIPENRLNAKNTPSRNIPPRLVCLYFPDEPFESFGRGLPNVYRKPNGVLTILPHFFSSLPGVGDGQLLLLPLPGSNFVALIGSPPLLL